MVALGISRWVTTRYRITPTVVEVRRGLLQRKHLTVPRDRVRTVDVSAHPLQRLLRLVKVEIGTGTSHHRSETLKLDGLPVATAAPLRAELLHRAPAAPTTAPAADLPWTALDAAPVPGVGAESAVLDSGSETRWPARPAMDRLRPGHPFRGGHRGGADRTRLADRQ